MKKSITFFLVLLSAGCVFGQVPSVWTTAKSQMIPKLNATYNKANALWNRQAYPTNFAGALGLANSNRGYRLFSPVPPNLPNAQYQSVLFAKIDTMLMAYDSLGYTAVDIPIQYPLLVNSFSSHQYYLAFYKRVYQMARARGFKITEGCQAAFVDSVFGEHYMVQDVLSYYMNPDNNPLTDDTLTTSRYLQEKTQMMQTIIDSLAPDYLTLEMEPETQDVNLMHLLDFSPDSVTSYIGYFTSHLNKRNTLLGSGAGTWNDMTFFARIAQTAVDFIDYHIYPVNFNFADDRVFKIDSLADRYNKKLIVGEAWCNKTADSEFGGDPVATSALIFSRNVFDYWVDVDTLFFKMMITLAQQSKIEVVSFFWSPFMFGQLTYDASYASMTPSQILDAGNRVAYDSLYRFRFSSIGMYTKNAIAIVNGGITPAPEGSELPESFVLEQNYPNPFNPTTTIRFGLPSQSQVSLIILDVLGREVAELVDGMKEAGQYSVEWNATGVASGVYFARFVAMDLSGNAKIHGVKKLLLAR